MTGGPPVTNIRNTSSPIGAAGLSRMPGAVQTASPDPNPETKKKDVVRFALLQPAGDASSQ
jgi:hypothetical protein